jgi:GMP synthase (glutamine-hydrolysing)
MKEKPLLILDFGAHNNQQVAKIARKFNVYCEVKPYNTDLDLIKKINPKALIFIGDEESKELDAAEKKSKLKDLGIPVLEFGNQKEPEEIKAFIFDVAFALISRVLTASERISLPSTRSEAKKPT